MKVDLNELYLGVTVNETTTTFFKNPTDATIYASDKINKGNKVNVIYCDKYGCKIA